MLLCVYGEENIWLLKFASYKCSFSCIVPCSVLKKKFNSSQR